MIIESRQRLSVQNEDIVIRIDDQIIKQVEHTKSLGVTIDAQLTWCKHVEEICKEVSSAIGALKDVFSMLPTGFGKRIIFSYFRAL